MDLETDTKEEVHATRYFHAWKCEVTNKVHRPNGRKQTEGCGKWMVKSSKHDGEDPEAGLMAQCKTCKGNGGKGPRKVRLNRKNRQFYTYLQADVAKAFCEALNNQKEVKE